VGLTLWASRNNLPVSNGPITSVISAQIVLTEINQFSKSSVVLAASDQRVIDTLPPFTLLEVVQDGVGTISFGYVLNPRQVITDTDQHTITVELEPLTMEMVWGPRTHRGWQAQGALSVIASRLATLTPGWSSRFTGIDANGTDLQTLVTLNDGTPLAGYLATGKQFDCYVRQGRDVNGLPLRVLEMGQFGGVSMFHLTSANGGDADAMADNSLIRLAATVERQPNDVTSLVNVCTPFGGGNTTDSLVTLERLWRILNDVTYVNFGKYGNVPGSVFPQYDDNYPISDPASPPIGATTYLLNGSLTSPFPGRTDAQIIAAGGTLAQGAKGTRYATLDGHWDYMVYDRASYFGSPTNPPYGYRSGAFIDSSLTYTDSSAANQELTAIALYLETIANFKHFAHPHHTFTATTLGTGIPTQAGDLLVVDFQRSSTTEQGTVVEMNVTENLRVMSVTRNFAVAAPTRSPPPVDTYVLSNLGRFDATDASGAATTATNLVALQIQQGTSVAPVFFGPYVGNADATHPIDIPLRIPDELFRWHRCSLRVDFFPYRATANTAVNTPGTPINILIPTTGVTLNVPMTSVSITVPTTTVEIDVPHGAHTLAGAFNAAGTGVTGTTDGFDLVQKGTDNDAVIVLPVVNDGTPTPLASNTLRVYQIDGSGYPGAFELRAQVVPNAAGGVKMNSIINFTKAKTQSTFTAPIQKAVSVVTALVGTIRGTHLAGIVDQQRVTGTIDQQTITAPLPSHTHPLDQRIPDAGQPSGVNVTLAINGGALTSGAKLDSGNRNADGTFSGSFEVDDIGPFIELPGQTVTISIRPGTNSGNPYGVGYFQCSGTFFGEFGSVKSIARVT